ncbi:MAG TPA: hypothetical protein VK176_06845 [Phycisphaerales bacterium]|nr:hypothetical protein [Phycisphaerales bacterium]
MSDAPRFLVTISVTAFLAALLTIVGIKLAVHFTKSPPPIGGQSKPAGAAIEPQSPSPSSRGDFLPTV